MGVRGSCQDGLCEIKESENKVTGKKGKFFTGCEIKVTGRKGVQNKRYPIFEENCNSVKKGMIHLFYLREGKCYFRVWNKFELSIFVKKRYAIPFMFKSIRHPNPSYELPTPVYMILYSSLSVVHSYQWGTPIQYMHCPL